MRKYLLLITIIVAIISCKVSSKDYTIISGKISNKLIGDVTINSYDGKLTQPLYISEDGSFVDTLKIAKGNYLLYDGKNRVSFYVDQGSNIHINYDANDFEKSLNVSGKGSEISNYLFKKSISERLMFGNAEDFYSLPEVEFKNKLDELKTSNEKLLNSIKGIPNNYKTKEKRNLNYFCLAILKDYELAHKEFTKNSNFTVSESFLNEFENLDFTNEEDFLFSPYYRNLVSTHYRKKSDVLAKTDSITKEAAYFKTFSTIGSETIKNDLLFDYANYSMGYSKDVTSFYNSFMAISTDKMNNAKISEVYNKLTSLAKGKPSPRFIDYENYEGGTTSLSDLKGKYVYIDVWATWCGPCIAEIPALKSVENEYHDKNIEFVSISIDKIDDKAKWKQMIIDKDLKGIQLFADNDWNSSFVKEYNIQGIPKFILIDPDGHIVTPNAPRPSSSKLRQLFTSLNI